MIETEKKRLPIWSSNPKGGLKPFWGPRGAGNLGGILPLRAPKPIEGGCFRGKAPKGVGPCWPNGPEQTACARPFVRPKGRPQFAARPSPTPFFPRTPGPTPLAPLCDPAGSFWASFPPATPGWEQKFPLPGKKRGWDGTPTRAVREMNINFFWPQSNPSLLVFVLSGDRFQSGETCFPPKLPCPNFEKIFPSG